MKLFSKSVSSISSSVLKPNTSEHTVSTGDGDLDSELDAKFENPDKTTTSLYKLVTFSND